MRAYGLRVYGRVQRVGYRRHLLELAQDLGIAGSVRNLTDGSVEVHVQGEEEAVNSFMEEARNPPMGNVKKLEREESTVKPDIDYFRVIYGELAEELQEGFGAMQTEFRDYRMEFRDYRMEFRDFRGDFDDYREEFRGFADRTDGNFHELGDRYGEISEKLSLTLETLREESAETRRMLREAIDELKRDSAETRRELKRSVDHLVALVERFLEA
ncbi:MAG: acylphosphatase [Candidatus Bathyarchaeia archaeon]